MEEIKNNKVFDDKNIIISNIENYSITFYQGNMILTKSKKKEKIIDIKNYDFTYSNLIMCKINGKLSTSTKYLSIVKEIYLIINNKDQIIDNTLLNMKKCKYTNKGYQYFKSLDISFQRVNSNKSIKEILHIAKLSNIEISMTIKLGNKEIITI